MFKNYIKIAIRNLRRNKFYSIINILGLAIGLASTILIGLYIQNEISYDKYHVNHKRIYEMGTLCKYHRLTCAVFCFEQMARKFRLQNKCFG